MELTFFAEWLNSAFGGFDRAILSAYHTLAEHAAPFFTLLASFFTLIGEKGLFGFLLGAVFLLFKPLRKCGAAMVGAIGIGAILTNFILKDLIARPRPFLSGMDFYGWWQFVGSHAEDGFSFPSGHVTAAMAAATALWLLLGKKWLAPAAAYVALMAFSRNYLMAHYPTDVIAACLVGGISALLSFLIVGYIWKFLEKKKEIKLFRFVLEFDLRNWFKKKKQA
jgi:undecaprenyl-diphosphatase